MRSFRSSPDLAAAVALAFLGLLVGLLPLPDWIEVVVMVPMAFLLPGYVAVVALFPPGALPRGERSVYVIALSIAISALSAIVLQLVVPLGEVTWTVLLFAVTCALAVAAAARREALPAGWPRPPLGLRGVDPRSLGAILAAVAIAAWAISISSEGARDERAAAAFSELWALPKPPVEPGAPPTVSIGVVNDEGETASFLVRVRHAGSVVGEWETELADGERWEVSIFSPATSEAEPLRVTLLKDGRGYRRVLLRTEPPV